MSVLGELLVQINGDNSGLNKSLNQSSKTAGEFANSIVQKLGGVALAYKALQVAIDGIQYNAMREQAEIAFGVFLGSADKAKAMIKSLQQVAIDTPLEFADVRDAGKQLLAYGVAAEDLVPTIKTLIDVSAGLNIPIKDLSYLYGTIKTQGRAMTVDINQFANRGIPIWEELAKVTGKNGQELRSFVEAGQVGFPIIEKAFQGMTSEGGKFFNMAVKQMDSFVGTQSNLSDATGIYLSNLTAGMMGPLKEGMISITKSMNDATVSSHEFGATLGKVFDIAVAVVGPVFDVLSKMPGEFTAIGIAAGIAFAVFGPWGALVAGIAVSIGAIGKYLDDLDKSKTEGLKSSFLSIAESSKMTADQTKTFLASADKVEQNLISWSGDSSNVATAFGNIAKASGMTAVQVANIAINSDKMSQGQKDVAQQFLKQNGLTAIGSLNTEQIAKNQAAIVARVKESSDLYAKQHPLEIAAAKLKAQADKDAAVAAKAQADALRGLLANQEALERGILATNAINKAGNKDVVDSLLDQNKLRSEYLAKLEKEGIEGKASLSFVESETARITGLNNDNLTIIKNLGIAQAGVTIKLQEQNDTSYEFLQGLVETGTTVAHINGLFSLTNLDLTNIGTKQKIVADTQEKVLTATEKTRKELEKIGMGKIFDEILTDSEDWNGRIKDVYNGVRAVWKDGFERMGESLVTGKGSWQGWAAAADKALASVLEGLGMQLAAMAIGKALMNDWTGAALATAGSIAAFVGAGVLNALSDQLSAVVEQEKKTGTTAHVVAKEVAATVTSVQLLAEAVKKAKEQIDKKSDTSSYATELIKQTDAVRLHYQKLEAEAANAARRTVSAMHDTTKAATSHTSTFAQDIAFYTEQGKHSTGALREYYFKLANEVIDARDKAAAKIAADGKVILDAQMQKEIDDLGYNMALFQQRADEAGSNLSSSFADALKKGTSETDFTKSIMDMLRGMAIDAAILAGGFADKFKAIGAQIAAALQDGFQAGEVDTLKTTISDLYSQATSAVTQINTLFPGFASGTDWAPGGIALVGEQGPELMNVPRGSQIVPAAQTRRLLQSTQNNQTNNTSTKGDTVISIQSNAPLDPLQTARAVRETMESLAFAGVA